MLSCTHAQYRNHPAGRSLLSSCPSSPGVTRATSTFTQGRRSMCTACAAHWASGEPQPSQQLYLLRAAHMVVFTCSCLVAVWCWLHVADWRTSCKPAQSLEHGAASQPGRTWLLCVWLAVYSDAAARHDVLCCAVTCCVLQAAHQQGEADHGRWPHDARAGRLTRRTGAAHRGRCLLPHDLLQCIWVLFAVQVNHV